VGGKLMEKIMDIKVSIIVPVYNLAGYIGKTLQSCVDQSYRNVEIIVVNDGSTDDSEIEIRPFLEDSRVRLFNQTNAGVSAARNLGIELATGDYLTFLDGDDTLATDTVEEFIKVVSRPGYEFKWFFFPIIRVLEDGTEVQEISGDIMPSYKFGEEKVYTCREAFDEIGSRRLPVCVCGAFYKSGFIESTFVSGRFEDSYMVYDLLNKNEDIIVISKGCYRYLHRGGSFINSVWTPEKWRDYVRVQLKALDTELRLFPSRRHKINCGLSSIRYNLRYLKFKNRSDKDFAIPLKYFDSMVSYTGFRLRGWTMMVAKCLISLFR